MNKKLLIIGFVWPEPKSSAAGSRMLQLVSLFHFEGYQITFASACAKSDNAFDIESLGVNKETIRLNNSSFDEFISKLKPDVVLFDRFMVEEQFGWRVAEKLPHAIRILDTEDLHFLRKGRQEAHSKQMEFSDDFLFNETTKREIASIYRCDLTLIISKAEMHLLQNRFKIDEALLLYLPFLMESVSEEKMERLPKFNQRRHFVTIGNFMHPPNYDALLYLKQTLWPKIKEKLPEAELHNYGAYGSQKVQQLHKEKEGFMIMGRAEDANTVINSAKVLLAPLRFGAGLKGKLFDAMKNGTPFITSAVGAEGILDYETSLRCISDNPEEFIDLAVKLYKQENLWNKHQIQGFRVLAENFSRTVFEPKFSIALVELSENLEARRQQNFIGQMLMHHSLQSTKYMAKWIEAKNTL